MKHLQKSRNRPKKVSQIKKEKKRKVKAKINELEWMNKLVLFKNQQDK